MMANFLIFNLTVLMLMFSVFGDPIPQKVQDKEGVTAENDIANNVFEYDYIIAYNISSNKNTQSCADFIETDGGPTNVNFTIKYTENGVKHNRTGKVQFLDNTAALVFNDSPNQPHNVSAEVLPNGVIVSHLSNGNKQYTLISYGSDKDLSKDADKAAQNLTANSADYKISRNGC